ncbi:MAG: DUF6266 family protein [Tannerella sp.]|jgi:hypothetical protein|nr:DUF6266 family protein [Tannerella sp.]
MGKINQGILGGFSGKVGTVVGGSWKGITYMRAKAVSIANPKTEAQQSQRAKLTLVVRFLQACTDYLRVGYKNYAIKQSAFNAATSYTLSNAITGTYPTFGIDPSKVMLSRGALAVAPNVQTTLSGNVLKITWDDNSGLSSARNTDTALAIVVNPDNGEAVYRIAGATRDICEESLTIPTDWTGDTVEVYLGFISGDGKDVSNSVYAGSVVIP